MGQSHFQVDQTLFVRGVGTVLSGTVIAGLIDTGQKLMLGPTPSGGFADVTVSGIHRAQVLPLTAPVAAGARCNTDRPWQLFFGWKRKVAAHGCKGCLALPHIACCQHIMMALSKSSLCLDLCHLMIPTCTSI